MESRSIKITDEHGIDRTANVIAKISLEENNYVIYWIERDSDNDNLFVSKLMQNNDGTSNMVNIENSDEKSYLSEVAKELITKAVNDEKDHLVGNEVILNNGKQAVISTVLFNKEQNINVQRTYITTIKKSVTKISDEYFRIEEVKNDNLASDNSERKEPELALEIPEIGEVTDAVQVETPAVVEPVTESQDAEIVPSLSDVEVKDEILPGVTTDTDVVDVEVKTEVEPIPEPVKFVLPDVTPVSEPVVEPVAESVVETPVLEKTDELVISPEIPASSVQTIEPIVETVPAPKPVVELKTEPSEIVTVFDSSKETNLKQVLEAAKAETPTPVDTIEPIREFGQEEAPIDNENVVVTENVPDEKKGFANSKFVMVVVIAFFLASCVFLGYEVFQYLQLK